MTGVENLHQPRLTAHSTTDRHVIGTCLCEIYATYQQVLLKEALFKVTETKMTFETDLKRGLMLFSIVLM